MPTSHYLRPRKAFSPHVRVTESPEAPQLEPNLQGSFDCMLAFCEGQHSAQDDKLAVVTADKRAALARKSRASTEEPRGRLFPRISRSFCAHDRVTEFPEEP